MWMPLRVIVLPTSWMPSIGLSVEPDFAAT